MGFGSFLGKAASSLYNNLPSLRGAAGTVAGYAAPAIGSAIGNYFGGSQGAGMGNTMGKLFGDYLSGSPSSSSIRQGMGYLDQFGQGVADQSRNQMRAGLGRYLNPDMQNTAMNTRLQDMGPTLGREYGQQFAQRYSPSWASPATNWLGSKIGSGVGYLGQGVANRFIPDYFSQSSPNQLAGMAGGSARNAIFNQMPQSMQNMAHFQEMPFAGGSYARGGYAMGGYGDNSLPNNGYAGYSPNTEYGLANLNEYGLGVPTYRPSLRDYTDMMPMS